MDALLTYSQTHQQLINSIQNTKNQTEMPNLPTNQINNPTTVSPINNIMQNQMYYHQNPNVDSYNQLLMNQYNMQQQQHQNSKVNDFFKLFSNSNSANSNATPPPCSIAPNSQSNFPGNFLQNSQQGLMNPVGFTPQLNGMAPANFMPNDEANMYHSGFNSSLVGRLASNLLTKETNV